MENVVKKKDIWQMLSAFIIYSILGFLLETVYAIFTKGMLESRKSFLYGPFCSIYGVAAICMIAFLEKYRQNTGKLYIGGVIIGISIEYIFSFLGEYFFHARWWDYSQAFGNFQGRICLFYACIWGFLAILLIRYVHPYIHAQIVRLQAYLHKTGFATLIIAILLFLGIDSCMTGYALEYFIHRMSSEYALHVCYRETIFAKENAISRYFSNEKMIKNYPNISVVTKDKQVIYLGALLQEYPNYYYNFKK